jgi:hypothetical protein
LIGNLVADQVKTSDAIRSTLMTKPAVNVEEQSVSGDIRTRDGQVINMKVEVPSDGSLWDEELIEAALMMIQESYPGAQWA